MSHLRIRGFSDSWNDWIIHTDEWYITITFDSVTGGIEHVGSEKTPKQWLDDEFWVGLPMWNVVYEEEDSR